MKSMDVISIKDNYIFKLNIKFCTKTELHGIAACSRAARRLAGRETLSREPAHPVSRMPPRGWTQQRSRSVFQRPLPMSSPGWVESQPPPSCTRRFLSNVGHNLKLCTSPSRSCQPPPWAHARPSAALARLLESWSPVTPAAILSWGPSQKQQGGGEGGPRLHRRVKVFGTNNGDRSGELQLFALLAASAPRCTTEMGPAALAPLRMPALKGRCWTEEGQEGVGISGFSWLVVF